MSVHLYICLCVCMSICRSIYPSLYLYIHLYVHTSVHISVGSCVWPYYGAPKTPGQLWDYTRTKYKKVLLHIPWDIWGYIYVLARHPGFCLYSYLFIGRAGFCGLTIAFRAYIHI